MIVQYVAVNQLILPLIFILFSSNGKRFVSVYWKIKNITKSEDQIQPNYSLCNLTASHPCALWKYLDKTDQAAVVVLSRSQSFSSSGVRLLGSIYLIEGNVSCDVLMQEGCWRRIKLHATTLVVFQSWNILEEG